MSKPREIWWGYVKAIIRRYPELCAKEAELHRQSLSRGMAGMPLNDRTTVTVEDAAAARWLLGDAGQTGGVLGALQFWPRANELVELAFRSGTGAFVMGVENLRVQAGHAIASPHTRLFMDYLPAECILPVTVRHGQVVDAAFAS